MTAAAWPAETVVRVPIADLTPSAHNSRTHSAAQVGQIAALMREYGWTTAVLRDEKGAIVAGHGRVLAAELLVSEGLERFREAPVMTAVGWSEAQIRAYIIADNKVALNAGWDAGVLASEIEALSAEGFNMGLLGFTAAELRGLLGADARSSEDDAPALQEVVVTRPGDVWVLGDHLLMCGDSTDPAAVARLVGPERAAMLVTSPPYWAKQPYDDQPGRQGAAAFARKICAAWGDSVRRRICINTGNTAETSIDPKGRSGVRVQLDALWAEAMELSGWALRHRRQWVKGGPMGHTKTTSDMVDQSCESLMTFFRPGLNEGGMERCGEPWAQAGFWDDIKGVGKDVVGEDHPCPYPVELARRFIVLYSKEGDTVADPFNGSGTTLIACEITKRAARAMDIAPAYVDAAVRRWQNFTGEVATLRGTGESFASREPLESDNETWAEA